MKLQNAKTLLAKRSQWLDLILSAATSAPALTSTKAPGLTLAAKTAASRGKHSIGANSAGQRHPRKWNDRDDSGPEKGPLQGSIGPLSGALIFIAFLPLKQTEQSRTRPPPAAPQLALSALEPPSSQTGSEPLRRLNRGPRKRQGAPQVDRRPRRRRRPLCGRYSNCNDFQSL